LRLIHVITELNFAKHKICELAECMARQLWTYGLDVGMYFNLAAWFSWA